MSYAFATRFPSELFEEIFAWVLEAAVERKFVEAKRVFIDATHIKASANRKKHRKGCWRSTPRACTMTNCEQRLMQIVRHMARSPWKDDDQR